MNKHNIISLELLTSPFCPLVNQMREDVKEKVKSVKGVKKVDVEVVF